jgi:5-formyltetrahydrofolate cyclo-ligase
MTSDETEAAKAALRLQVRKRRASLSAEYRADAARLAALHFFNSITLAPGEVVAGYWPIRDEMDCQPILVRLMDGGQPLCLPVVMGPDVPLSMRLWEPGAALYPSGFGTLAPSELAPEVLPDIVIVPLLGFDGTGTRLGYGGGYYDRTLASLSRRPRLVGLAYAAQEVEMVPREAHDLPLDAVVTEDGVIDFTRAAETA